MMRKAFLFTLLFTLITLAIVSYFWFKERVYPHVFLNAKDISFLKKDELSDYLDGAYRQFFKLKIHDRMYTLNYKGKGILLDKKATEKLIFENNEKPFPKNVIVFANSLFSQKMLLPVLVFTNDFSTFVNNAKFDFTKRSDEVYVDNSRKSLTLQDNQDIYKIDGQHLQSLILLHFGKNGHVVEPRLDKIIDEEKREIIDRENKKINSAYSIPIEIIIPDDQGLQKVNITSEDLRNIFDVRYEKGEVVYLPKDNILTYLIEAKADPLVARTKKINLSALKQNVVSVFNARVKGVSSGPIVAETKIVEPTRTHGEVASRYIEVSISQQKMYLFDQGNMIKSYTISSGLYYPTPVGHFNIMNKALEGYSDIYNVYMPYWMAFYYGWAGEQDAYFGIHELPYWYVGEEKKQRPREFLGSPRTGGCVSLDIGAAKEVYDFSYVGMDVVVYE